MIFSGKKNDGNAEVDETADGDQVEGVVGMEASICKNNYAYPREVYHKYFDETTMRKCFAHKTMIIGSSIRPLKKQNNRQMKGWFFVEGLSNFTTFISSES